MSRYNNYIGVCNIKMSMCLADHRKTEENGFWELTGIRLSIKKLKRLIRA